MDPEIPGETLEARYLRLAGAFNKGHFSDQNIDKLITDIEATFQPGKEPFGYFKYLGLEKNNPTQSIIATKLSDRFIEKINADNRKLEDLYSLKDFIQTVYLEDTSISETSRSLFVSLQDALEKKITGKDKSTQAAA